MRFNRRFIYAVALGAAATIGGCTRSTAGRDMRAALAVSKELRPPLGPNTLSREHGAAIEVPESDLGTSFRRVTDRCTADIAHHCVILQSNLSSGQYASGLVKLRIDPEGVEDLVSFASRLGKLQRRSTKVEDLADAIADTHSRIEPVRGDTAVAYMVPWLFVVIPGLYLLRFLWRRRGGR